VEAACRKLKDISLKCQNDHVIFANSSPSVGIFLITKESELMLSVRGIEPHKGMLDTFGGFLDEEETAEEAVARELKEELGITPADYGKPQMLCTGLGHYPYKGEVLPLVSIFFWAHLLTENFAPDDDVARVFIGNIKDVDPTRLHDDDIRTGFEALQKLL
jgi:NAD+ diphosphatase